MSELLVPTPVEPLVNSVPPEGGPGSIPTAVVPPAGFVSQADFDKEQARTRSFQGERDRLAGQLAVANAEKDPAVPAAVSGFDPNELRRQMLKDNELLQAARDLRTSFPDADPALFGAAKLLEYGSVEAFQYAVKDSHDAVVARFVERDAATEAKVRAEFVAKYGAIAGGETPGVAPTPGGDPTPEVLARMTDAEVNALEVRAPGTYERVLRLAS